MLKIRMIFAIVNIFTIFTIILLPSCASSIEAQGEKPLDRSQGTPPVKLTGDAEGVMSKAGHFVVKLDWPDGAKAEQYIKARLAFATADRFRPETVTDIVFDPQMPSMGHGTATEDQVISAVGDGRPAWEFQVDGVYFIMDGPWEINVTAVVNGLMDTAAIPVDVVH